MTEFDEETAARVAKLPGWARELISQLRTSLETTTDMLDEARREAWVAAGKMPTEGAKVAASFGMETSIGLPDDVEVDFAGLSVSLVKTASGIGIVVGGGQLAVFPEHTGAVRIAEFPAVAR